MPTTDERMDKVLQKASRMKRRRSRITTPIMSVLAVLLGVGLVGSIGSFTEWGANVSVSGLFGSSIVLGSNVGGYVIVALLAAALAAIVTLICVNRAKRYAWYDSPDAADKDDFYG